MSKMNALSSMSSPPFPTFCPSTYMSTPPSPLPSSSHACQQFDSVPAGWLLIELRRNCNRWRYMDDCLWAATAIWTWGVCALIDRSARVVRSLLQRHEIQSAGSGGTYITLNTNVTLQGRLIIGKCWTINLRNKEMLGFVSFVALVWTLLRPEARHFKLQTFFSPFRRYLKV